jgi:hypothetical protein
VLCNISTSYAEGHGFKSLPEDRLFQPRIFKISDDRFLPYPSQSVIRIHCFNGPYITYAVRATAFNNQESDVRFEVFTVMIQAAVF